MDKKSFMIEVNENHELSKSEYVRGRISGIVAGMLSEDYRIDGGIWKRCPDGTVVYQSQLCTAEQASKIADMINKVYPGLCMFCVS